MDASVVLEVLLQTTAGERVRERLFSSGKSLCAPHLLDLEVAQVLRRYVRSGAISPERGEQALLDLADLPLQRYPHFVLLPRIWQLRNRLTAFDAAYLALAETLDATLVTRDAALGSSESEARA